MNATTLSCSNKYALMDKCWKHILTVARAGTLVVSRSGTEVPHCGFHSVQLFTHEGPPPGGRGIPFDPDAPIIGDLWCHSMHIEPGSVFLVVESPLVMPCSTRYREMVKLLTSEGSFLFLERELLEEYVKELCVHTDRDYDGKLTFPALLDVISA